MYEVYYYRGFISWNNFYRLIISFFKFPASQGIIPLGDSFREMRRLLKIRIDGRQQRFVKVGQLFAVNVQVQSSGFYTCRTFNKAGADSKSMHLYVHPKPEGKCKCYK